MTEEEAEAEAAERNARDGAGEWVAVMWARDRWEVQPCAVRRRRRLVRRRDAAVGRHWPARIGLGAVALGLWFAGLWLVAVEGRLGTGGVCVIAGGFLLAAALGGGVRAIPAAVRAWLWGT